MEIRKHYKFSPEQLGFQPETGTETAIVRHVAQSEQMPYTAVLDFKAAYDSVPRDNLMQTLTEQLPGNLTKAIAMTLQDLNVETIDDNTNKTATIQRGVTQGSPLSPTIFNVYMDPLVQEILKPIQEKKTIPTNPVIKTEVATVLFADDVKIQSKTPRKLQEALNRAHEWAERYEMTWSTPK